VFETQTNRGIFMSDMAKEMESGEDLNVQLDWRN